MSATLIEKALTSTLGYLPRIENLTEEEGLLIGLGITPDDETLDDPGTRIGFVIDPARRAMAIRIGDERAELIHPIDGPDTMDMRMVVRITDPDEWSVVPNLGGQAAMSLLFGGQPEPEGRLAWNDILIREKGDFAMIELNATSRDRQATARLARGMRGDHGWVPTSLRDAIFEIAVGSSDAPAPLDMGYEIVQMESWPDFFDRFPNARVAVEIAMRDDPDGIAILDQIVEGDMAVARGRWRGGNLADMVTVDRQANIIRIFSDELEIHLPDTSAPDPAP